MSERSRGHVKFFNDRRGFGFISDDAGGVDCFVHHSKIQMDGYRTLKPGEHVEFERMITHKGPEAISVTVLSEERCSGAR
ncbi:MAG: cold shock domain-containing protein [Bryobacterales bacterium]|nr:cold shock domain-containing protein [Bryobacterales bacterium]